MKPLTALGLWALLAAWPLPSNAVPAWEVPPRLDALPEGFRGFPKHGEFMAAGVACRRRPADWERRYHEVVERAARRQARSPADAAAVMQMVDAYAAYARRRVAANRSEYCNWTASPENLTESDAIIAGREPVR